MDGIEKEPNRGGNYLPQSDSNMPSNWGTDVGYGSKMTLLSSTILRGYNIHHSKTVIRQEVHLGDFAELQSRQAGPGFTEAFIDRFLRFNTPCPDDRKLEAFLARLNSTAGAPMGEVLFQAILAVEAGTLFAMHRLNGIAYTELSFDSTLKQASMVWSCHNPKLSRGAAALAFAGLNEILPEEMRSPAKMAGGGFEAAYEALEKAVRGGRFPANKAILVQSAENKGIPWEPLVGSFIRLGQGKYQRHIKSAAPGKSSVYGEQLANDKRYTNQILSALHIPVPRQAVVSSLEDAQTAAAAIGYPVVIKPSNQKGGRGIMTDLKNTEEIRTAFQRAREYSDRVLVESQIVGTDHRMMIVDGKFLAASMRSPPVITGDGKCTIGELITELNTDPLRDGWRWKPVTEDSELTRLLGKAGHCFETVLKNGETLALRSTANISTGGSSIDLTDSVHPHNRELAVRAAKALGLDVAGVDFMTTDISQSYKAVGGAIIEVNGRAGFRPHTWVVKGQPRDVAGAVIDNMFTLGNKGRVRVATVAGRQGRQPVARALDHILRASGMSVGMVNDAGAIIDGEPAGPAEISVWKATETALRDPRLEAFITTVPPKLVVKRGLIHDECETTAILDIADAGDIEETRQGLDVIVHATQGKLIVGAKNPLAMEAVQDIDVTRVVLVSRNAGDAAVRRHLAARGPAVVTARDRGKHVIVLLNGETTAATIPVAGVHTLGGQQSGSRLDEHLFAVALAWGMGLSGDEITSSMTKKSDVDGIRSELHPSLRNATSVSMAMPGR